MSRSLVIDHGNTKLKYAIFNSNSEILLSESINVDDINLLFEIKEHQKIDRAIYSYTGPVDHRITEWIKEFKFNILFSNKTEVPIEIDYDTSETLGLDRIANACAASFLFEKSNALIIDVGTCITYDLIDSDKQYKGGAISPGPYLRAKSMNDYTESLPLIRVEEPVYPIETSTIKCLESGVYNGILFEINGFIEYLKTHHEQLTIILTGGYTSLFANDVKNSIFADSNFTLKGLNQILLYNAN